MGKFKVGDRVRRIEESMWPAQYGVVGEEYTVLDISATGMLVIFDGCTGAMPSAFELVERPWQPKVGDRVRFTDACSKGWWFGPHTGNKEGEIRLDYGADYEFQDGRFEVSTGDSFGIVGLEHIEPLPVAAEAQLAALTIQTGKFYKTRDGRKVGPIGPNEGGLQGYPWQDDSSWSDCWTADGRYYADEVDSDHDLIAEWVDEPAPAVAATASNDNAAPKFKVGDRVQISEGAPYILDENQRAGEIIGPARKGSRGIWRVYIDNYDDDLAFEESELTLTTAAPQQSTAGFTIPLVEDEPAAAKDGSTQLTVRITSDFTELHEQIDYAFERLKKLKKKARKLGIELDFAKAA